MTIGSWAGKNWFITGASTGFGRALAELVLARGGRVVATARDVAAVRPLVDQAQDRVLALPLDVLDTDAIDRAIQAAEGFGGIDVLVNNAGYGFLGGVEESSDEEIAAQIGVNFFGPLRLIRKALPAMRARNDGFIVNFSSISGVGGFPGAGFYAASKFAIEGLSESLAGEVERFGIKVMIVEPGYFRTDFSGRSIAMTAQGLDAYDFLARHRAAVGKIDGTQIGDPARGVRAIVEAMDASEPPRRLVMGSDAYAFVDTALASRKAELEAWKAVTQGTDFPVV